MKRIILWLAKIFKVSFTPESGTEKIIYKPIEPYLKGLVIVDGNLIIKGTLRVSGEITCYTKKEDGYVTQ